MIPNSVKLIAMAYKWQQESLECLNTILKSELLPPGQKEAEQLLRETVKSSSESFSLLTKLHLMTKQLENVDPETSAEKLKEEEMKASKEKKDVKDTQNDSPDNIKPPPIEKPRTGKSPEISRAKTIATQKARPVKAGQTVKCPPWSSKMGPPVPGHMGTEPSLKVHQFPQEIRISQPQSQNLARPKKDERNQSNDPTFKLSTSQSSVVRRAADGSTVSTASSPKSGTRAPPKSAPSQRAKAQVEPARATPSPKPKATRPQSQIILSPTSSTKQPLQHHLIPATTVLTQENEGVFDFTLNKSTEEYNNDDIRTVVASLTDQNVPNSLSYSIVTTSPMYPTPGVNVTNLMSTPSICASVSIQGNKTSINGSVMPNQDRSFIYEVSNAFAAYAVFDGHGENGHQVAETVCQRFLKTFKEVFPALQRKEDGSFVESSEANNPLVSEKYLLTWLRSVFRQIDAKVIKEYQGDLGYSGCTASVAVRCGNAVYVGYVGDSKVIGIEFVESKATRVMETPEHSPSNETELTRIQKTGAHVSTSYYEYLQKNVSRIVEAGISVSRAFGDLEARKYGLICRPEFVKFERRLKPSTETPQTVTGQNGTLKGNYYYPLLVVLATDGLWDTLETQELLLYCKNDHRNKGVLEEQIKLITRIAWSRRLRAEGRSDDTTATVILV